jgi:hypothetical protein
MQQRWINIRIEPSLHQIRLPHAIPALVPHIDLHGWMRRQVELFLDLARSWRSRCRPCLNHMTLLAARRRRHCLIDLAQHPRF